MTFADVSFTHNITVPRTAESFGVPTAWTFDREVFLESGGLAAYLLSFPAGTTILGSTLEERHHPNDRPLAEVVEDLERGGYFVHTETGYELVHPDRLPPLPDVGK